MEKCVINIGNIKREQIFLHFRRYGNYKSTVTWRTEIEMDLIGLITQNIRRNKKIKTCFSFYITYKNIVWYRT